MASSRFRIAPAALVLVAALSVAVADGPDFGGPNAVEKQLREDEQAGGPLFGRFADWKARLKESRGVDLGFDYSAAYFTASDSPGDDRSGVARGPAPVAARGTDSTDRRPY